MESYLHKQAKELLFAQIEKSGQFVWKTETNSGIETLIDREEYRHECLLMEFPTGKAENNGMYPDEIGVCTIKRSEYDVSCRAEGYRFNNGSGYCSCSQCGYIDYSKVIIHDIAAFWKGHIYFAIEIINKHEPSWFGVIDTDYPVYIIQAENVLKRVSNSAVYVDYILNRTW
jgi:hypothetical protein